MKQHYNINILLCAILLWCIPIKPLLATPTTTSDDKEKLERAIQYFQSGKFHEALLLFTPLSKKYTLSKRTIAYMGVCCYYEGDYEMATSCFAQSAKEIEYFAPQERAVYYFCKAESMLQLKQYADAVSAYEMFTTVCHPNEKAEAYFKMATCYMAYEQWQQALFFLISAQDCNKVYSTLSNKKAQKANDMIKECHNKLNDGTTFAN